MKNYILKISFLFCVSILSYFFVLSQKVENPDDIDFYADFTRHKLPPDSKIQKEAIIQWLKKRISSNTPYRNKFVNAILENALFDEMYPQRKGSDINGRILIVPLKKSYFSQHISITKPLPFQFLQIDVDKDDKIFTMQVILIYPDDLKLQKLPKNIFNNYHAGHHPVDGTYIFLAAYVGDSKYFEMDIKNRKEKQSRQWTRKSISPSLFEWTLTTSDYIYLNNEYNAKLEYKTENLGTSNKMCPPMYVGDIRTKDIKK